MDAKVHNYNEIKHQDRAPHMKGKAKECYKRIELVPTNWATLKVAMERKYEVINPKEIIMKLDVIK
jgi:hypothetical protein